MKNKSILVFFAILISFHSFSQHSEILNLNRSYFGQKTPESTPEVFAPGIVSLPTNKYCTISFSAKIDELFLYRWNGEKPEILCSKFENGKWSVFEDFYFDQRYKAMEPHLTLDGKTLYYVWDKPLPEGNSQSPFNIWYSERTSTGWSEPKYAGIGMFISSDKNGNIYTTDMTSVMTTGKTYLAKVNVENGKFISYERLQIPEFYGTQAHPCIAPDGSYILFDVDSGHHLFVSFRKEDGSWSNAIDLTNHGFDTMAGGASITPDGKYLFFNLKGQLMWVDIKIIKQLELHE